MNKNYLKLWVDFCKEKEIKYQVSYNNTIDFIMCKNKLSAGRIVPKTSLEINSKEAYHWLVENSRKGK